MPGSLLFSMGRKSQNDMMIFIFTMSLLTSKRVFTLRLAAICFCIDDAKHVPSIPRASGMSAAASKFKTPPTPPTRDNLRAVLHKQEYNRLIFLSIYFVLCTFFPNMEHDTKTRMPQAHSHRLFKLTSVAISSTSDKTSFAYISARDRWPVILVCTLSKAWNTYWHGRLGQLTMFIEKFQTLKARNVQKANESLRS